MHNTEKAYFHVFACIKWGVVENRVGSGLRHFKTVLRFILKENGFKTKKGEQNTEKGVFRNFTCIRKSKKGRGLRAVFPERIFTCKFFGCY